MPNAIASNSTSLQEMARSQLMAHFSQLPQTLHHTLIIDPITLSALSASLNVSDLLQFNISLVEKLFLERQPFPQMGAVYLLAPTNDSVERLLKDWDRKKPMYKEVFLFFSGHASDAIMSKLKQSKVVGFIQQLKEINLEFLPIESQVFSYRDESDLLKLYGDRMSDRERLRYVAKCAQKLACVFSTLNDVPTIRYYKDSNVCKLLAEETDKQVKKMSSMDKSMKRGPRKTVLLIVDRSHDPVAPLAHEFTYQAMAYDLLKIGSDMVYTYKNNDGEEKQALLNEQDPIWVKYRHKLIVPDAKDGIRDETSEFRENNKDLAGGLSKDSGSTRKISKVMHRLPDYQKTTQLYSLHLTMINDMMKIFDQQRLPDVAIQEQNMAVNQDENGQKLTNVLPKLGPLFRENVPDELKLRLVLLYLITQGMTTKNQERLFKVANLEDEDEKKRISDNLTKMGISTEKKPTLHRLKKLIFSGKKKKKDYDNMLTLCRFQPKIKEVMEDLLNNDLSKSNYPYLDLSDSGFQFETKNKPTSSSTNSPETDSTASRSKRKRPSWVTNKKKKSSTTAAEPEEKPSVSPPSSEYKVVVFSIGGATWSEARSAYEVSQDAGVPCYMGSTSMLTPHSFIEKLEELDE